MIKDGLMRVRYKHNQITSVPFKINAKHRTLLRMEDEEQSALHVEVTATDFNGVRVIFQDYQIGDAPVLIVNSLEKELNFSQVDDMFVLTIDRQFPSSSLLLDEHKFFQHRTICITPGRIHLNLVN